MTTKKSASVTLYAITRPFVVVEWLIGRHDDVRCKIHGARGATRNYGYTEALPPKVEQVASMGWRTQRGADARLHTMRKELLHSRSVCKVVDLRECRDEIIRPTQEDHQVLDHILIRSLSARLAVIEHGLARIARGEIY